jgi:mono/diheme cytochrome c family protein
VLSTGGNLLFEGTGSGYFEVRAADTGRLLWSKYLGGSLLGAPTTVFLEKEQLVLLPFGNSNSSGVALSESELTSCAECRWARSRILAFKLGGKQLLPRNPQLPPVPKPPISRFSDTLASKGKQLFAANACDICHGLDMINGGGTTPDLTRTGEARHGLFSQIVRGGLLNQTGMPRFSYLSDDELKELQAYIINGAWDAYEAQSKRAAQRH